jgi:hypothetical protein
MDEVKDDVARRIAAMCGIGGGLALDPKPFFRLGTSLTSLPGAMAYALKPKFSKAEAMERIRARYGA